MIEIEVLLKALTGYFLLNLCLALSATFLNMLMRHQKGKTIIEFNEVPLEELKQTIIQPIIVVIAFIPIMVYATAAIMAEQLIEVEQPKKERKNKWDKYLKSQR